jgi:hypothetical protein
VINPVERTRFTPTKPTQDDGLLSYFTKRLPNSVLALQYTPVSDASSSRVNPPSTLEHLARTASGVDDFINKVKALEECEINAVERESRKQHTSTVWQAQRQWRITASNFHDVATKVNSITKKQNASTTNLVGRLSGKIVPNENVPALKHGRVMEAIAKQHYVAALKRDGHTNVKVRDSGLVLDKDRPYLGASPDLLVSCCCGEGLCEIKCPYSAIDQVPCAGTPGYLVTDDHGKTVLYKAHKYYAQIQGQMGVVHRPWCDLFVFTRRGAVRTRVEEDSDYWAMLRDKLDYFFREVLAVMCFESAAASPAIVPPSAAGPAVVPPVQARTRSVIVSPASATIPVHCVKCPPKATGGRRVKKCATLKPVMPVYLCKVCDKVVKETVDIPEDNSIGCDQCGRWYHWICVNIHASSPEVATDSKWYCKICLK